MNIIFVLFYEQYFFSRLILLHTSKNHNVSYDGYGKNKAAKKLQLITDNKPLS